LGGLAALAVLGWSRRSALRGFGIVRLLALGGVAVIAVAGLAAVTGTADRVPQTLASHQTGGASRLAEWRVATRVVLAHPLTGVGPEGYRIAFGRAVDAGYQRNYGRNPIPDRAHDSLLDVAVSTGVPGLLFYVALLSFAGVFALRALRRGPPWLAGVAAGLVAYVAAALWLFPIAELEPAVWLLAGMVCVQMASSTELVALRLPAAPRCLLVGMAGMAAFVGVGEVAADQAVRVALEASARGAEPTAVRAAQHAVHLAPDDIVVRLVAAEVDASTGTLPGVHEGLGQVRAALRVSPRDPVLGDEQAALLLEQAQLSGQRSDWQSTEAMLNRLVAADPRNPVVLLQLGVADTALGRARAAAAALTSAAALDPRSAAPQTDLALLDLQTGRRQDARLAAVQALLRDPTDAEAAALLAELQSGSHGT
jgi:hypothetical protein